MPEAKRPSSDTFGPNAWLVDEMFEQFREDPLSVSESWREFFEGYKPAGANLARRPVLVPSVDVPAEAGDGEGAGTTAREARGGNGAGAATGALLPPGLPTRPQVTPVPPEPASQTAARTPIEASREEDQQGGIAALRQLVDKPAPGPVAPGTEGATVPLRGGAARLAANMTTSLEVPTATSFRVVPAKLLEVNRLILNNQLARSGTAGKVSFTHIIGWAVVQAVQTVPALNS
ncbi:MAG TPA: 2-oxo acid dehydrogenase subunit E2, partial [Acidimicrobiales bacterium]|nr:2-oxo acid dehydrogenase subunit E2 [Acidimicrobiales bacterium]